MVKINLLGNGSAGEGGSILKPLEVNPTGVAQEFIPDGFTGYSFVKVNGVEYEDLTADSSTEEQTFDSSVGGYMHVKVNPYTVEEVTVDSSTADQEIVAQNADALKKVIIKGIEEDECIPENILAHHTILSTEGIATQLPGGLDVRLNWMGDGGQNAWFEFTGLEKAINPNGSTTIIGDTFYPSVKAKFTLSNKNTQVIFSSNETDKDSLFYIAVNNERLYFTLEDIEQATNSYIPIDGNVIKLNEPIELKIRYQYTHRTQQGPSYVRKMFITCNGVDYTFDYPSLSGSRLTDGTIKVLYDNKNNVKIDYLNIYDVYDNEIIYEFLPVVHWLEDEQKYTFCYVDNSSKNYYYNKGAFIPSYEIPVRANYINVKTNTLNLTLDSSTNEQVIVADKFDCYGRVVVKPYTLTEANVTPSETEQVIVSEKDGLSKVTVSAIKASDIQNLNSHNVRYGVNILGVIGDMIAIPSFKCADIPLDYIGNNGKGIQFDTELSPTKMDVTSYDRCTVEFSIKTKEDYTGWNRIFTTADDKVGFIIAADSEDKPFIDGWQEHNIYYHLHSRFSSANTLFPNTGYGASTKFTMGDMTSTPSWFDVKLVGFGWKENNDVKDGCYDWLYTTSGTKTESDERSNESRTQHSYTEPFRIFGDTGTGKSKIRIKKITYERVTCDKNDTEAREKSKVTVAEFIPVLHWDENAQDFVPCFKDTVSGKYAYNSTSNLPEFSMTVSNITPGEGGSEETPTTPAPSLPTDMKDVTIEWIGNNADGAPKYVLDTVILAEPPYDPYNATSRINREDITIAYYVSDITNSVSIVHPSDSLDNPFSFIIDAGSPKAVFNLNTNKIVMTDSTKKIQSNKWYRTELKSNTGATAGYTMKTYDSAGSVVASTTLNGTMTSPFGCPKVNATLFGTTSLIRIKYVKIEDRVTKEVLHWYKPVLHWNSTAGDYEACFKDTVTGNYISNTGAGKPIFQLI